MLTQDPITDAVAKFLGMSVEDAENHPRRAAKAAADVLRQAGFSRRYNNAAWDRGMRWYNPGSDVPREDLCATSLLGIAIIEGLV